MTTKVPKISSTEKLGLSLSASLELARRDYSYYYLLANSNMKPQIKLYPHIKLICKALQKIIDGEQHFYVIEMPPQHGKSLSITKTFPSYFLMKYPEKHAMITAYSEDLYSQFARNNRRNFMMLGKPLYKLDLGQNTSSKFSIKDHDGGFLATSILGGATGMSADLLIIDDPIKNAQEARSKTIKDRIWAEWNMTFYPRLQQGGSVIIIMTRWQKDDLAGRLLKRSKLPWEEIKLPAIAYDIPDGKTDAIGRHNGDALCPELHSLKELESHKHDMGTQNFTALYQQSPTVEGGNIFKRKWVKYYVPDRKTQLEFGLTDKEAEVRPKRFDNIVTAWDATFKSKANSDYVAGQTWGVRDAKCYLLPAWCHKRLDFMGTLDAIREQATMYPQATAKLVEDKANGPAIINVLRSEIAGIVPVSPGSDSKESRAISVSPVFEAGQIYVPHPSWHPEVEDLLEEWFGFPNMPHDDQVDSMVYAVKRLVGAGRKLDPDDVIGFM